MAYLSDRDIKRRMTPGYKQRDGYLLVVKPLEDAQIGPCSIDLRLGTDFIGFDHQSITCIDPAVDQPDVYSHHFSISEEQPLVLHPGEFVLGTTIEWVEIPVDLMARIDGRSSIGRLGICIHSTAGFIDSGFQGNITLEMSNEGKLPVILRAGVRICNLSFAELTSPALVPYGKRPGSKYQGQKGAEPSRLYQDKENTE